MHTRAEDLDQVSSFAPSFPHDTGQHGVQLHPFFPRETKYEMIWQQLADSSLLIRALGLH